MLHDGNGVTRWMMVLLVLLLLLVVNLSEGGADLSSCCSTKEKSANCSRLRRRVGAWKPGLM